MSALPRGVNPTTILTTPSLTDTASSLTVSRKIRNGFSVPLKVIERGGLTYILPPAHINATTNQITVEVIYQSGANVILDIDALSNVASDPDVGEYVKALLEAFNKKHQAYHLPAAPDVITSNIPLTQFNKLQRYIYLDSIDVVICDHTMDHAIHPHSAEALRIAETKSHAKFGYRISIIDPEGVYGHRYVNINGSVFKVTAEMNSAQVPGVYLQCTGMIHYSDPTTQPSTYYSFEDADAKLGLFTSPADAKINGDHNLVRKRELEELQHANKMLVMERERLSTEHKMLTENAQLEAKRQYDELVQRHKMELLEMEKRLKDEQFQQKLVTNAMDQYTASTKHQQSMEKSNADYASFWRKDFMEWLKWVTPPLSAIVLYVLSTKKATPP